MILWRISNHADLSGLGGIKAAGRWHSKGRPVVYLAEHPALALLEVLVHLEAAPDQLPDRLQFLRLEIDERASLQYLPETVTVGPWPPDPKHSRRLGDRWLEQRGALLLRVPSVVTPRSWNYLFNPLHLQAGLATIAESFHYPLDRRLF